MAIFSLMEMLQNLPNMSLERLMLMEMEQSTFENFYVLCLSHLEVVSSKSCAGHSICEYFFSSLFTPQTNCVTHCTPMTLPIFDSINLLHLSTGTTWTEMDTYQGTRC